MGDCSGRSNHPSIQGETPIEFLNKIQKVAYRVNPFIYKVAETLMERGVEVGKFIPVVDHEIPPKPADIAENYDARHKWRREAAEARNKKGGDWVCPSSIIEAPWNKELILIFELPEQEVLPQLNRDTAEGCDTTQHDEQS